MPQLTPPTCPDRESPGKVSLVGDDGLRLTLMTLGARVAELWVPDPAGNPADVVLGLDRAEDHRANRSYMGATCGRFANRIAGGSFTLDGVTHQLDRNEGANQLHGGSAGFDSRDWIITEVSATQVSFSLTSVDGDMGYPGRMEARCTYRLLGGLRLMVEMTATTDAPTIVNLAHHSYYNLAGHGSGDILGHSLQLGAQAYLPVDTTNIPTGEIAPVAGTAFDFTSARRIGQLLPGPGGFDHCFCLDQALARVCGEDLRICAALSDPASGRRLRIWTTAPGVQVYTGAHFDGTPGKAGAHYPRFGGVALETQGYPDAPNHSGFPSTRLDPGQTYRHLMLLDFGPD
jgi:aldose 1-epimerase